MLPPLATRVTAVGPASTSSFELVTETEAQLLPQTSGTKAWSAASCPSRLDGVGPTPTPSSRRTTAAGSVEMLVSVSPVATPAMS